MGIDYLDFGKGERRFILSIYLYTFKLDCCFDYEDMRSAGNWTGAASQKIEFCMETVFVRFKFNLFAFFLWKVVCFLFSFVVLTRFLFSRKLQDNYAKKTNCYSQKWYPLLFLIIIFLVNKLFSNLDKFDFFEFLDGW